MDDIEFKNDITDCPESCKTQKIILSGHNRSVVTAKYNSLGSLVATASADKSSQIYSSKNGKMQVTLTDHTLGLNDCVWIGENCLVTCSDDKTMKVWDIERGVPILTVTLGHKSFIYSLAVHPYNDLIISGGYDGTIRSVDIRSQSCCMNLEAHSEPITSIDVHPNGSEFITASFDGLARVWDFTASQCLSSMNECVPLGCVSYSTNGQYLLVGRLNDAVDMKEISGYERACASPSFKSFREFKGLRNRKYSLLSCIHMLEANQYVVSGSEDSKIYLWDIDQPQSAATVLCGHEDAVLSVVSNPDPSTNQILSASKDGTSVIWNFGSLSE